MLVQEKEYFVRLTLHMNIPIGFAPAPRATPITKSDAIENAIATIPDEVLARLADEGFAIAYPIIGEATERTEYAEGDPDPVEAVA